MVQYKVVFFFISRLVEIIVFDEGEQNPNLVYTQKFLRFCSSIWYPPPHVFFSGARLGRETGTHSCVSRQRLLRLSGISPDQFSTFGYPGPRGFLSSTELDRSFAAKIRLKKTRKKTSRPRVTFGEYHWTFESDVVLFRNLVGSIYRSLREAWWLMVHIKQNTNWVITVRLLEVGQFEENFLGFPRGPHFVDVKF